MGQDVKPSRPTSPPKQYILIKSQSTSPASRLGSLSTFDGKNGTCGWKSVSSHLESLFPGRRNAHCPGRQNVNGIFRLSSHSSIDTYAPVLDHKDPNPALLVSSLGQDPRLVLATQGPGLLAQGTSSAMVPMKATPTYRISESKQLGIFRPGQAMNSPYAHQGSSAMPSPSPMQGTFMPSQLGLTPFPKFVNVPSGRLTCASQALRNTH